MTSATASSNGNRRAEAAEPQNPLHQLSAEQIEAIGRELDELHDEIKADLGDRDARYIRGIIGLHRRLGLIGRALLLGSRWRGPRVAGTATLSLAKILENMEIGHNVLHGQWDWMNDPVINSSAWDWDTASSAEAWKHSHNYIHHTYTNILGKDKDLGYEIMRIDPHQRWHPVYLLQPIYNVLLALAFEWGVAFHDMDLEAIRAGEKGPEEVKKDLRSIAEKARLQITKDYIAWPLLSGVVVTLAELGLLSAQQARQRHKTSTARKAIDTAVNRLSGRRGRSEIVRELVARRSFRDSVRATARANFTANLIRNVWSYAIIFCGHFPDQTYTFTEEDVADETRGGWYVRQLVGAANIDGGPLFHVISGNLGFQVEHHLFPDMPSSRYAEIAPRVREICERYALPYNTGPFHKQLGSVQRTILRLAFPGGKVRPKPGPYRGESERRDEPVAVAS